MPSVQDKVWYTMWKENSPELRQRAIIWRKQNAVTRVERPSRLLRAKRLGYKAKQGIVVVRMRVGTGGMRRQRPRGGRRPKHLGVTRIKADDSMKVVSERFGHSSISITMDLYSHILPAQDREAADALDEVLRGAS